MRTRGILVNKAATILGTILIAAGIVAYVVLQIPIASQALVTHEAITIRGGSSVPRVFHLPSEAHVSGTMHSVTGGAGDINFYIFNKHNYDNWISGASSTHYIYIYRASTGALFTFTTDKEDEFYFVFDNPVGGWFAQDRFADWSASCEYKPYAFHSMLILATLVVVGTLLVTSSYIGKLGQKIQKLRICPNCNKKIRIQNPVCPHCGFDVNKSIRCKYCNTFYDRTLAKCPNCGAQNK